MNPIKQRLVQLKALTIFLLIQISLTCFGQDCNNLSNSFSTFSEAEYKIRNSKFVFKEKIITSKSSWIDSVSFFSCDKQKGYLLIQAKNRVYIHKDVPIKVWESFRKANSYGTFYNSHIKGRYLLYLRS